MSNNNRSFWIDPDGPSLDFLKKCLNESAERVREREETERKRRLAEEEQKRVEAELRRKLAEEEKRRRTEEERRGREEERRRKEDELKRTAEAENRRKLAKTETALARFTHEVQYLRRQNQWLEKNLSEKINEGNRRTQQFTLQRAEILPPAVEVPALPKQEAELPQLDLSHFEDQIREAASTLDLKKPEGWLDKVFGRPDHRIRKKTERAQHLANLVAATKEIIVEYQRAIDAVAAAQRSKYQLFLDRLEAILKMMEAQYRLELARRNVERQDEQAEERHRAEIERIRAEKAEHQARAREAGLRGYPPPPPPPPIQAPPPPAPPPPEDPRAKAKANYERDLERLTKEEVERITKITGGKPEADWSDDIKDEVIRTKNMYGNAREKIREKLKGVL